MNRSLCPILALSCASTALAGPIDSAWVSPDAAWVIHVDLEGLLGSQGFRNVTKVAGVDLAELENEIHVDLQDEIELDDKEIPPEVIEAWRNMDFKVTEDIKSITAFGSVGHDEPDLVILRTTDAVDQIIATLDPIQGVNVAEGDQVSFVALRPVIEGGEAAQGEPEQVLAIRNEPGNERTIVVAETVNGLVQAMDRHTQQGGQGAAEPEWLSMRPGSYLLVHVSGEALHHIDGDDPSRILEKARELRLEAGESAGQVYVDAMVDTESVEVVNQVTAIANGLMAMGRLALSSEDDEGRHIISLMNALTITTEGTTMHVQFGMDTDEFTETIEALHEMDSNDDEIEINIQTDDEE